MGSAESGFIPSRQHAIIDDGAERPISAHMAVLLRANGIYERRTAQYGNAWEGYGWRGCLVHLRTCVERAWRQWWNAPKVTEAETNVDNLLDTINYAVLAIRNIEAGNRDGMWEYDEKVG